VIFLMKKLIVILLLSMFSVGCSSFEVPDNLPWDDCLHHDHHPGVITAKYDHHHYEHHRIEGDSPYVRGLKQRIRQRASDRRLNRALDQEQRDNRRYWCGRSGDC